MANRMTLTNALQPMFAKYKTNPASALLQHLGATRDSELPAQFFCQTLYKAIEGMDDNEYTMQRGRNKYIMQPKFAKEIKNAKAWVEKRKKQNLQQDSQLLNPPQIAI